MSLEEDKLSLEIKKLKHEQSAAGIFGSVIWPVLASFLTILLSGSALIISLHIAAKQQADENKFKEQELLSHALEDATDSQHQVDRRIAGIWSLGSFWSRPEDEQEVASILSAELSLANDDNRLARCAAAQVIGNAIAAESLSYGQRDRERSARISRLLYGNRDGQIGLVTRQNIRLAAGADSRDLSPNLRPKDCVTALDATKEAIRQNWEFLENINLNDTNLRRISLYEADLTLATFERANLDEADFKCANLSRADFDSATHVDTADFRYANLRDVTPAWVAARARTLSSVDLSDEQWSRWRTMKFPVTEAGQPFLGEGRDDVTLHYPCS